MSEIIDSVDTGVSTPDPETGATKDTLVNFVYQQYNQYGDAYPTAGQLSVDEAIVLRDALIALGL